MKHNPLITAIRNIYSDAYQLSNNKARLKKAATTRSALLNDIEKYTKDTASFTPSDSDAHEQVNAAMQQALEAVNVLHERHQAACNKTSIAQLTSRYHWCVERAQEDNMTGFYDVGAIIHYHDNTAYNTINAELSRLREAGLDIQSVNTEPQFSEDGFFAVALPSSLIATLSNTLKMLKNTHAFRASMDAFFIPPAIHGKTKDDVALMTSHYSALRKDSDIKPLSAAIQSFSSAGYACITLFGDSDIATQFNHALSQWFEHIDTYANSADASPAGWIPTPSAYDETEVRLFHIDTSRHHRQNKPVNPIDDMAILGV